jgi:glyoxylase-like metal-dependent hydrolase (beta-lactamase superfamily II)
MFGFFSKPNKNFYGYRDYGSFLLCKPGKDYKINANISIIKGNEPILYDAGLNREMLVLVKEALKSTKKTPSDLKKVIISHYHPDHVVNLMYIWWYFPNCKIIWHKYAYENLITFSQYNREKVKPYNKKLINFLRFFIEIFETTVITKKNKNYICKDGDIISSSDSKLKVLHTPGHSSGHICLLDSVNKVLFLGDFIPFTPWLDLSSYSVDDMINSIKKLLKLSSKEVEYSVRAHGNLKDNWNEVYPWEIEKERFEAHLELIYTSLEKIPKVLKRGPMTVETLAFHILKNKDFLEYSSLLNRIFLPPNLSWIICYLLKLQKEDKVKQMGKKWILI